MSKTHTLNVVNIKCGGCAERITESLEKIGLKDIKVDPENQTISFKGDDVEAAAKKVSKMGYPLADSAAANNLGKKAKSYVSCAIGRWA